MTSDLQILCLSFHHSLITHAAAVFFLTSSPSFCPSKRDSSPYFLFAPYTSSASRIFLSPFSPCIHNLHKDLQVEVSLLLTILSSAPLPPYFLVPQVFCSCWWTLCLISHVVLPIPSAGIDMACILLTQQSIAQGKRWGEETVSMPTSCLLMHTQSALQPEIWPLDISLLFHLHWPKVIVNVAVEKRIFGG